MSTLAELTVQLDLQSAAFQRGVDQATAALGRLEQSSKGVNQSISGLSKTLTSMAASAVSAVAGLASIGAVLDTIKTADKMKNLEASLATLTGSSETAARSMTLIKQTAEQVGLPVNTVAEATQRLTIGLQDLGGGEKEVNAIVKAFAMLGRIGGTSVEDVKGALIQFSQAISSGKLGGDELKSIQERMPLVGKIIAEQLGVSVGQLKNLGAEGELTGAKVGNALLNAAKTIETKFNTLPNSFDQASARLQNRADEAKVAIEKAFNLSNLGAAGLDALGVSIRNVIGFIKDVGAAWTAASVENKIAATSVAVGVLAATLTGPLVSAIIAVGVAMRANPLLAILGAIASAVLVVATNWDAVKLAVEYDIPAALKVAEARFAEFTAFVIREAGKISEAIGDKIKSPIKGIIDDWNKAKEVLGFMNKTEGPGPTTWNVEDQAAQLEVRANQLRAEATKLEIAKSAAIAEANRKIEEQSKKQDDNIKKLVDTADANDKGGASAETFAEKLQKLTDKLDPASKSARDAKEAIDLLNQAMEKGMLTPERYSELLKKVGDAFSSDNGIKGKLDEILDQMNSFTKQFVDGIVDAAFEGKLNFEKLLKDISKSIIKWLLNSQIQQFFKSMKGLDFFGGGSPQFGPGTSGFWAKGGAFNNGVEFFASGGVVGSATAFGMAGGRMGVMGEAGPEAIVPLKRASNGDLGVKSSPVVVNVINQAGVKVETSDNETTDGRRQITMLIRREVSAGISDGSFDKQFRSAYGMTRQGY